MSRARVLAAAAGVVACALVAVLPAAARGASAGFYAPGFEQAAKQQWAKLISQGDRASADLLAAMETTPRAVWVTGGTPHDARVAVQKTVHQAEAKEQLPVFVAYNVPGRDCGGLSAGGATTESDYDAWIDGVARGLGDSPAIVILEPDGLGLLPDGCNGGAGEPPFTDAERFAELNAAVDRLKDQRGAIVYLDATHSAWLNVHDAASRLLQAGVQRADGFFLNVSNFQYTENQVQYGTWISKCIARIVAGSDDCPDQYWNGGPHPAKIADLLGEWTGVALSRYGVWSDASDDPALNTSGENLRYADTTGTTHFVVDTSRNGRGPWQYPASYGTPPGGDGAALDWCNPPGRGLGPLPAAQPLAGNPLVDAYLWIKTPGESDGACNRSFTSVGSPDPEWGGIVDPAAGQWFSQQALQLAQLAVPPLP